MSGFSPQVTDKGDGTYTVSYSGLPKYVGNANNPVTYTLSEGAITGYTADTTSIQGTGNKAEGTITNTHKPETTPLTLQKFGRDRRVLPLRFTSLQTVLTLVSL